LSIPPVLRCVLARGRDKPAGELPPPGPGPVRPTREAIIILVIVVVSVLILLALHVPVATALAVVGACGVISAEIALRLATGRPANAN
jgi:hypothetical protein